MTNIPRVVLATLVRRVFSRSCAVALAGSFTIVAAFLQNGGHANAQARSEASEHGPLAPQANAWVNNQNASVVLGQSLFTTSAPGAGLNQMNRAFGVAIDAATGKVFVADGNNNRVLRFTSAAALSNGSTAEASFGGTGVVSANTMSLPTDVTIDAAGNLWVADNLNSRVLRFGGAATLPSGSPADVVLGQALFTTNTAPNPPTASSMSGVEGVYVDSGGHLWVADRFNSRVLRFDSATTLTSGAAANGVLGQSGFTTNVGVATQSGMNTTVGVTVDSAGRLWVADRFNNRVLRFDNASTLGNGAAANGVLGQAVFTTSSAPNPPTAGSMNFPEGLSVDSVGRLYVGDNSNNRVLIFNAAATKANGANADKVLGQPGFTTNTANNGGVSASSLSTPRHLIFDNASQTLFVSDDANNRVLRFAPAGPTAAGVTVSGRVMTPDGRGLRNATVVLIDESGNAQRIRTALGAYRFVGIAAGQTYVLAIESNTYRYSPRVLSVDGEMAGLDFVPTANARGKAH